MLYNNNRHESLTAQKGAYYIIMVMFMAMNMTAMDGGPM